MRSKLLYQLNDSADRSCQQDKIAPGARRNGIANRTINRTELPRFGKGRLAVAADDPTAEPMFLDGKAERAADQAGADDGDLAE